MSTLTSYIIFWMVFFVLLGAFWYVIDRRYGTKWYRRWFNLTHRKPLPADVEAGFIYNRKTRHKVLMATLLSTAQTVAALFTLDTINLLVELILWIVEVPMTILGFFIGPWAYRLWQGRGEMFDAIDQMQAGEKKTEPVVEAPPSEPEPEPEPEPRPEKKSDEGDDDDPREMMRRYTDGR